jgi:hypothetical protein
MTSFKINITNMRLVLIFTISCRFKEHFFWYILKSNVFDILQVTLHYFLFIIADWQSKLEEDAADGWN